MKSPSLILKVWIPFWQGLSANLGQLTLYFTHIEIMKHYEYKIHFRNRHSLNVRKKKFEKMQVLMLGQIWDKFFLKICPNCPISCFIVNLGGFD
jgi:hypothetical protein